MDSQRTDLWLLSKGAWDRKGREGMGIWNQQRQTVIYRMGGQQGPIVQHRNCIQYPVVNHNGKDCEKNMKKQYI